jgi:hypothetical protein
MPILPMLTSLICIASNLAQKTALLQISEPARLFMPIAAYG